MERKKRKNAMKIVTAIFIVVIVLVLLWWRWGAPHVIYKNYEIVVKKHVYCEKTRTGRVDLQIKRRSGKKVKLLQTEQELKKSQSFKIVQDKYELGIQADGEDCIGDIYEQKYAGGTQYLTLYYANSAGHKKPEKMYLVLKDKEKKREAASIKTSPKRKEESRRFLYRGKELYLSQEGVLLDVGDDGEFYRSQAMKSGVMTIVWKDGGEKPVQIQPDADLSNYKTEDIIVPKLIYNESTRCYYAMELKNWEDVLEIRIGENVFEKTKKIDDTKEPSKENTDEAENSEEIANTNTFYTKDMSLLDQPEEFKISDYYITNRIVAGNRYYIDDSHILWGQGMNYYAQLGINHPEDVGNWYHVEYTEPQKIAEHVVHVDASENGYFMMYLTENGDLYGAGANLSGVLGKEIGEDDALNPEKNVVNEPKLLMNDVSYMRTGATSVAALKKNGEVYWWGEFMFAGMSDIYGDGTLVYTEPHKMLDDAIYVTTASSHAAALKENGDLYTWGDNTYGQCGYAGGKSLLREPEKVMDQVRMVWCDTIEQNALWKDLSCVDPDDYNATNYDNTFVLRKDGQMYGAGSNIGSDEKRNMPYGEGEDDERSDADKWTTYSEKFLPIKVEEYVWESNPSKVYTGEKEIQIEGTAAEGLAE